MSITPVISEVTLHESINLRRENAGELLDAYAAAHSKLSAITALAPAYVPSADALAEAFGDELLDRFTVIDLEGEHAREALRREALRILPARGGRGARDSAIWLTIVDLVARGGEVHLVTNNVTDFGKDALHPAMMDEIAALPGEVKYHLTINAFLDSIAIKASVPPEVEEAIEEAFGAAIRAEVIENSIEHESEEHTPDRILDGSLSIADVEWDRAYSVDDTTLAMVRARFVLTDEPGRPNWASGGFTAWISFDSESRMIFAADIEDFGVDFH
jgi:hypothetical protein